MGTWVLINGTWYYSNLRIICVLPSFLQCRRLSGLPPLTAELARSSDHIER
jgi:hypothetical protein